MLEKKNLKKSRLIQLISTLSILEIKRLGRFLKSPHFNSNKDIVRLFEVLKKHYPHFSASKLDELYLYHKIYGKEDYQKAKLQDLFSKMLRLVESYILDAYLDKQQGKREVLLTEALGERLYKFNLQKTNKLIDALSKKGNWRTADDFYQMYQLSHNLWYHPATEKLTNDHSLLSASQDYLDHAYLLEKLAYIAALSSRATFLNTHADTFLDDLKIKHLDNPAIANNEYKLLFLKVIQMHESKNLESYKNFKTHLFKVENKLTLDHRKNFLLHLINFGINFRLAGEGISTKEIFELYQIGVQEQFFIKNDHLRDIEFTNICIFGFRLGQDEWVNNFINHHQCYLLELERTYLLPFVEAYQKLFNKEFESVIDLLKDVQPKHHLKYHSRIQSLLIRAFFECMLHNIGDYKNVLNAYLTNLKMLMNRNKKNTALKTGAYLNFIKILKKLIPLLNSSFDEIAHKQVTQLLNDTKPLIFKGWLVEKLAEIEIAASKKNESSYDSKRLLS